jgi:photosystem II stability/assembly factor-like uncharacterized protein
MTRMQSREKNRILKNLVLLALLTVTSSAYSHDYWLRQQSPTTAWLTKISFPDSLNGWAAGDSGVIIHTSDGGLSWVRQNSGVNVLMNDIQFINPRLGWGIANDYTTTSFSIILYTTNGGITWNNSFFEDSTVSLLAIYFLDSLNGWTSGFGGVFFQTTDGGQNWIPKPRDTANFSGLPVRGFTFRSPQYGFAGGGTFDIAGVVWKTTNSGMFWTTQPVGPEPIFDFYLIDSLDVIGCGGDYEYGASLIRSTNAGGAWTYLTLALFGVGQAIAFRYLGEVWLPLGFSQRWAVSFDSLETWQEVPGPDSSSIYDALFVDTEHGWGCGSFGVIVKYNPNPIGIENNQTQLPARNTLYQNYPNPFNPSTSIKYYLAKPSVVRIKIYDVLGREVKTILESTQKAGEHSLRFSGDEFSTGVYFYKLETEGFSESRKMVIVR